MLIGSCADPDLKGVNPIDLQRLAVPCTALPRGSGNTCLRRTGDNEPAAPRRRWPIATSSYFATPRCTRSITAGTPTAW